jgi:thioesterase domain-containing protein
MALRLFAQMEKVTDKKLPLATLFQAPTIEQFADILRRENWTPSWNSLVPIQPGGSRRPLFLVHGVGGNVLNYHALGKLMAPDQPVYGLQSIGMDGALTPLATVEAMATAYIKEMRALQPEGPYYIGGMSFGAMVAWEMAIQLTAQGQKTELLALLDAGPWGAEEQLGKAESLRLKYLSLAARIRHNFLTLLFLPWQEKITYFRKKKKTFKRRLKSRQWQKKYIQALREGHGLPPGIQNVKEANFMAAPNYRPRPYAGHVTVFRASEKILNLSSDPKAGWKHLALGGVTIHEVPGNHLSLVEEPHVRVLVEKLRACLATSP